MLSDPRETNFQIEDMSILRQLVFWNCVKMSMIVLF